MSKFRSTILGEECQCHRCAKIGYGEDSWHPCTNEFWPMTHGGLVYSRCKACMSEVVSGKRGIVQ